MKSIQAEDLRLRELSNWLASENVKWLAPAWRKVNLRQHRQTRVFDGIFA